MKVRDLANQLQDLARRGFGDDTVQIEVGGAGRVVSVEASASKGVWLKTSDEA